jgi:hypothetical protein
MHVARLRLTHYGSAAVYRLRENLQLNVTLPYDVKAMRIRYTTLDGQPFTPARRHPSPLRNADRHQ